MMFVSKGEWKKANKDFVDLQREISDVKRDVARLGLPSSLWLPKDYMAPEGVWREAPNLYDRVCRLEDVLVRLIDLLGLEVVDVEALPARKSIRKKSKPTKSTKREK